MPVKDPYMRFALQMEAAELKCLESRSSVPNPDWTELLTDNGMTLSEFSELYVRTGGQPPEHVTIKGMRYQMDCVKWGKSEGYVLRQFGKH